MITAYTRTTTGTEHHILAGAMPARTVWLDLESCTPEEYARVAALTKVQLPELRELRHLQQDEQYYAKAGAFYAISPIIIGGQTDNARTGMIMFILTPSLLITIRQGESQAVKNFATELERNPAELDSPGTAFTGLMAAILNRLADLSEIITHQMDSVSQLVFQESLQRADAPGRGKADSWKKVLQGLGRTARLNHRIISVLDGLEKVVLHARDYLDKPLHRRLDLANRNIAHLTTQSNAMVNEATFLLDAIVGAISIEQNNVIKIFSMVAVILMPPTMVASIYGMNFTHMPELGQVWGYPAALLLMVVSGFLPWWWFKRNGWF